MGLEGNTYSQETRNRVGRSFSNRMANRLQTSLPPGGNIWSAEGKDSEVTPGVGTDMVPCGRVMPAPG